MSTLAAGLPMVTGQVPMGYDLDDGWVWRLPGNAPWDEPYIRGLADLLDRLTPAELAEKRAAVPDRPSHVRPGAADPAGDRIRLRPARAIRPGGRK